MVFTIFPVDVTVQKETRSIYSSCFNGKMQPNVSVYFLQGISGKSQILFAIVFTTRYLDLLSAFISLYNSCMKASLHPPSGLRP